MTGDHPSAELLDRLFVQRRIDASADALFRLLCDPAKHVEIDGTGMLRVAGDGTALTHVGQTFEVDMDRRPQRTTDNTEAYLDLVREVPDYRVTCTITQLVPGRLIEWAVQAVGKPPAGHVWGWQILPLDDGQCLVTNYCDWTNVRNELRARFHWPVVPVDRFARSVENLERIATGPGATQTSFPLRGPGSDVKGGRAVQSVGTPP